MRKPAAIRRRANVKDHAYAMSGKEAHEIVRRVY
jgi:hypothetical protein